VDIEVTATADVSKGPLRSALCGIARCSRDAAQTEREFDSGSAYRSTLSATETIPEEPQIMPIYVFNTFDDPLATAGTQAVGINDMGQIVGLYGDGSGNHGFLLSGGVFTTLNNPSATNGTCGRHQRHGLDRRGLFECHRRPRLPA
jgi:hypothetical protein